MGNMCFTEYEVFTPSEIIDGQSQAARNLLIEFLDFTDDLIDKYFTLFRRMCEKDSDYIDTKRFLGYLKVEDTPLMRKILAFFDVDKSGKISFIEFTVNLYNLLAMRPELMGGYFHAVADYVFTTSAEKLAAKGSKEILTKHVLSLFQSLEGVEVFGPTTHKAQAFRTKFPLTLTDRDLKQYVLDNKTQFSGFQRFLTNLEKKTLGPEYATKARKERSNLILAMDPTFMNKLIGAIDEEKASVKRAKERAKEEKWLSERKIVASAKHKRRESKLLTAFNMHPTQKTRAEQQGVGYNGPAMEELRTEVRSKHKAEETADDRSGSGTQLKVRRKSVVDTMVDAFRTKPQAGVKAKSAKSSSKKVTNSGQ